MEKLPALVIGLSLVIGASPFIANSVLLEQNSFGFNTTAVSLNQTELELGIDTGANLNFGNVPQKAAVTKYFNISSERTTMITLDVRGNISDSLTYDRTHLINGRAKIPLKFNATEPGFYTGDVRVKTESANGEAGKIWLKARQSFSSLF